MQCIGYTFYSCTISKTFLVILDFKHKIGTTELYLVVMSFWKRYFMRIYLHKIWSKMSQCENYGNFLLDFLFLTKISWRSNVFTYLFAYLIMHNALTLIKCVRLPVRLSIFVYKLPKNLQFYATNHQNCTPLCPYYSLNAYFILQKSFRW